MLLRSSVTTRPVLTGPVAGVTFTVSRVELPGSIELGFAAPVAAKATVATVKFAEQLLVWPSCCTSCEVSVATPSGTLPTVTLFVKIRSPATASPCPPAGPSS